MGLRFDLHLHTARYSRDSAIDPEQLIAQAVKAGLHGLVITEHHHQWRDEELAELSAQADAPGFVCLAGFEYTSARGDLLVYGLAPAQAGELKPGAEPEEAARRFTEWGGVCIAAHPTRERLSFDERLLALPVAAMEVRSVNLKDHEQRLAERLSATSGIRAVACSDAHRLRDVGRHHTVFEGIVRTMDDLRDALRNGTFRAGP